MFTGIVDAMFWLSVTHSIGQSIIDRSSIKITLISTISKTFEFSQIARNWILCSISLFYILNQANFYKQIEDLGIFWMFKSNL